MLKFFLIFVASLASSAIADDKLIIDTPQGAIQGYINTGGVRQWKGIPYAQPPVDSLRWKYPKQIDAFSSSPYVANYDAPGCPQVCNLPPGNCPDYGQSEDCLFLSVFSPVEASEDPGTPLINIPYNPYYSVPNTYNPYYSVPNTDNP